MTDNTDWKQAMEQRRSVRAYEPAPLQAEQRERLQAFLSGLQVPFSHRCSIVLFPVSPEARVFGPLPSPSEGAAFLSPPDEASRTRLGFVGEMFILYAWSLGIGTCWTGHFAGDRLPEAVRTRERDGSRICCVTPLGFPRRDGPHPAERIGKRLLSGRRKQLSALLTGVPPGTGVAPELLRALEWSRRAPSALNGQPWDFHPAADGESLEIRQSAARPLQIWKYPEVDVGISACHFWLGLRAEGLSCTVEIGLDGSRVVWRFAGIGKACDREPPQPDPVAL